MSDSSHNPPTRLHQLFTTAGTALDDCLAQFQAGDHLLLVDRGAAVLMIADHVEALKEACNDSVSATLADVEALGLKPLADQCGMAQVDDAGWVRLVMAAGQVLSWK